MYRTHRRLVITAASLALAAPVAAPADEAAATLQPIEIEGEGSDRTFVSIGPARSADTARRIGRAPGGSVADNGPVSSQVQYRGLFGPRMNVRIDGMAMTPGGPNWMDPQLHTLPPGQVESLEVERGIAPVSSGDQTLGGTVRARSKQSTFGEEADFEVGGSVGGAARSANDSGAVDAFFEGANRHHRFHFGAVTEEGDDTDFGDGTIAATEFERDQARFGYGHRGDFAEIGLNVNRTETGDSGNPSLPLDMELTDTDIVKLDFGRDIGDMRLEVDLNYQSVEHEMGNVTLRPTPDFTDFGPPGPTPGPDERRVEATGDSSSLELSLTMRQWGGELEVGGSFYQSSHDQDIVDPTRPPFFVTQFNDADKERASVFGEWTGAVSDNVTAELGLRLKRTETDAGRVDALPARVGPPPPRNLRDQFNASDRGKTDNNIDAVLELDYALSQALNLQLGLARKTRSPTHIERYLWLPLEVSAGLADFNNYVGNIDLDPEVAHKLDLGLAWGSAGTYARPRVFYSDIDDFIAGTPATDTNVVTVSRAATGDKTPQLFSNVGAEIYGFDLEWGARLARHWRVDGTVSAVRGERDSGDDLFRMPADRAITGLTYSGGTWSATVEAELVAKQSRISETLVLNENRSTNDDTAGYGLLYLSTQWRPTAGLNVVAGIDNVLDKSHVVHTNGFNRVQGSDVGFGERLPGTGRNVFVELGYQF